jgi:hypothetical protein
MAWAQAPNGAQAPYRPHAPNTLTPEEQQQGWQLLFDGQDLKGWHSYQQTGTGKGLLRKYNYDNDRRCLYEPLDATLLTKGHGGRGAKQPVFIVEQAG